MSKKNMVKGSMVFLAFRRAYGTIRRHMAKVCPVTDKHSSVGGRYSNRTRATQFNPCGKRRRQVNLLKRRIFIPELAKHITLVLSTNAVKTINKNGAYATLKKAGLI